MGNLFFKLQCLFLNIFFVEMLLCTQEMDICSQPIKIYKDFDCIHRLEDIQSHIRVYSNATFVRDLYENLTNHQIRDTGMRSRITSVNLLAYPILNPGSHRYRAHFCIEVSCEDLCDADFMMLVFSTREKKDFVFKSAVFHHFFATFEITVHLEVTFVKGNGSVSNGKYYFRIPFWEQFNREKEVNPCSFAPFTYAEESEEFQTEVVSVGSVNCSRSAFVLIEQRKESSGGLVKMEIVRTDELGRGQVRVKYTESLHYYEASFQEKAMEAIVEDIKVLGESSPISIILFFVLMLAVVAIVFAMWCQKVFACASRHSVMLLREKPRVKFLYCRDNKFQIYRRMAETLILFMEKYCNIVVSDHSIDFHESSKASLLPKKCDVIVLIPFPPIGENNSKENCTIRSIRQWKGTKKECIIMELPFWSGDNAELEELCDEYKKWKRFTLMDEFLPLVAHIQRSSYFQRFSIPVSAAEMQAKLEESNLTNDGFAFCLKEAFGDIGNESDSTPDSFINLQEMEM